MRHLKYMFESNREEIINNSIKDYLSPPQTDGLNEVLDILQEFIDEYDLIYVEDPYPPHKPPFYNIYMNNLNGEDNMIRIIVDVIDPFGKIGESFDQVLDRIESIGFGSYEVSRYKPDLTTQGSIRYFSLITTK